MTAQSTTTSTTARTTLAQHGGERTTGALPAPDIDNDSLEESRYKALVRAVGRAVLAAGGRDLERPYPTSVTLGQGINRYYITTDAVHSTVTVRRSCSLGAQYAVRMSGDELFALVERVRDTIFPQPPVPAVVAASVEPPVPPSGEWFGRVTVSATGTGRRQVFARPAWATPEPPYANYRFDPQTGGYDEFAPYRSVAHEAPF